MPEVSCIWDSLFGSRIGDRLEEDWRNLIHLSALKSKSGHAYMHTCMKPFGGDWRILAYNWINFLKNSGANRKLRDFPLKSLDTVGKLSDIFHV